MASHTIHPLTPPPSVANKRTPFVIESQQIYSKTRSKHGRCFLFLRPPVYNLQVSGQYFWTIARFHLAFTQDRRNWTNFLRAKCASLGPQFFFQVSSRSKLVKFLRSRVDERRNCVSLCRCTNCTRVNGVLKKHGFLTNQRERRVSSILMFALENSLVCSALLFRCQIFHSTDWFTNGARAL